VSPTPDGLPDEGSLEPEADRFFDPWRVPASDAARSLIAKALVNVLNYEKHFALRCRKRKEVDQRTLEATVSAIICDLMHAVLMEDTRGIAISRSNRVLGKGDRYAAPAVNRQLPYVLDVLSKPELDWLAQDLGYGNPFGRNQRTLIRPSECLIDNMREYGIKLNCIGRCKAEEVIILKAEKEDHWDKGAYLPYPDTAATHRYRDEMRTINSWLAEASIEFDQTALRRDRPIDTANRTLRRHFTQGSFESGGRLFGGFWQGLSKAERLEGLAISGEDVVGLDYGQIAPRILYGLTETEPPEGDLYEIPGLTTVNGIRYQDGVKKMMNTLMFSDPKRKPMGTKDMLPPALSAQDIVSLIKEAHPAIAYLLGTEVGHTAQFIESQVMVRVLLRLREECIAALPIHDGLVVPSEAEDRAKAIMKDVFEDEVGVQCPVSVESLSTFSPVSNMPPMKEGIRQGECTLAL
jgi:hypothetical protein